ncbi:hypothetical protein TCAL_10938 [Tigriopus californicus]|uniref:Transmembrane protein 135 N-terminal domain-containing protein n=1 Tax=Tigriopus californicus TaxID=6832 RepID=A0A553PHL5_TIGCA|nr:hypothetical protein TCAL_10938 [Tigriopus californicus]
MGTKNSKLKPMYYTCHEIAHTWHPSCTWVALEIAESCFWEALKIYGAVYGVSTMLKGKIPSREQMRTLIWNTIQSSIFLSVNTGAYISVVCLLRRLSRCFIPMSKMGPCRPFHMGSIVPFAIGQALQAGLFALPMIQGRSRNGLSTILSHISRPDVLLWSCFLGSFPAVYKLASCFLRNALGVDHRWNAIPAGFLAGLTMAFSPSRSMCLYSVWKTLEIVCTKGVQNGTLPRIPLGVEILYASSTSVLLHLGVVSPQSLKPSYWKFVSRITGDRFLEVNRPLLDHTYNVSASALLPNFEPRFPRPDLISAECQAIGQEFKGKYNTFSL